MRHADPKTHYNHLSFCMIISAFSSYSEPKEFAIQKLVTNDTVERENNKREGVKNAAKTGKRRWMPTEKVTVMEDYGGDDENENDSPSHKKAIAASMPIVAPQKPVFHLEIIKKNPQYLLWWCRWCGEDRILPHKNHFNRPHWVSLNLNLDFKKKHAWWNSRLDTKIYCFCCCLKCSTYTNVSGVSCYTTKTWDRECMLRAQVFQIV